jgi:hypothetical protein
MYDSTESQGATKTYWQTYELCDVTSCAAAAVSLQVCGGGVGEARIMQCITQQTAREPQNGTHACAV